MVRNSRKMKNTKISVVQKPFKNDCSKPKTETG